MLNIIRSVNYGLRRDAGVIISVIAMIILPFFILTAVSIASGTASKDLTPSFMVGTQLLGMIFAFSFVGITIISCKAMGMDGSDKTINYEIMSGHRRFKIFAGRTIAGIMWGTVLILIIDSIPVLVFYLANGWGKETDPLDIIFRMLLLFFPILRLSAFGMMLASVFSSAGKGIAAGFGAFMITDIIESVLAEGLDFKTDYVFGFINILSLLIPQNSREFIIDGKPVTVFETAVTGKMIYMTVLASLFFTVLYLTVSYILFRKKDR